MRCGGIYSKSFITNCLLILRVKKKFENWLIFGESVRCTKNGDLFAHPVDGLPARRPITHPSSNYLIATLPGVELRTLRSQVRHPTVTPPSHKQNKRWTSNFVNGTEKQKLSKLFHVKATTNRRRCSLNEETDNKIGLNSKIGAISVTNICERFNSGVILVNHAWGVSLSSSPPISLSSFSHSSPPLGSRLLKSS